MVQSSLLPRKAKKVTRNELSSLVDRAADLIRTAVDYKFILVLLFLKRLNDLWKVEKLQVRARLIKESGLSEEEAGKEADREVYHTFNIPKQFLWDEVTKDVKNLPERLATAISETAKLNPQLQGVINRVDFLEFARNQENRELLRQLVELFDKYDLGGEEVSPDVLGDAYEHILMKFAPQKAKEGEIYTPREVIKLMVEILDPKPGESVYDPCCGSGGMLIIPYLHVAEKYGQEETRKLFLYGQERNPEIYAVGQMNLLLHEIKNANLANGDTLDYPRFRKDGDLEQFDVVIANIPWNQDGYGEERLKKSDLRERFSFGYATKSSADWAWIQHMLTSAKQDGRVGLVVDNGCLFRGGAEETVRRTIIQKDLIECVILLPPKLFYNTGAPGAIVIFNKDKPSKRKDKILFINAFEEFEQHPLIRRLNTLSKKNIKNIVQAVEKFAEVSRFSKTVNTKEIIENYTLLVVPLYIMLNDKKEKADIAKEIHDLKILKTKAKEIDDVSENLFKGLQRKEFLPKCLFHTAFKETEIGEVPKHWNVMKVGDVLSLEYGKGLPERERKPGKHPVVGSNGVVGHHEEALVKGPGIVVGRKGTIGAVSWIEEDFWPIDTTYYVKVKTPNISLKWLFYQLSQLNPARFYLADVVPGLKRELVYALKMPLPPKPEQEKIAEILTTFDNSLELKSHEKEKLEKVKQSTMDILLSGGAMSR